ncbi:hypothetical protein BC831DRAFT_442201 [Entophlyctis helioformis]|nr:hypothetical protein BC831DRAFT_442201 [Entophlyctis helioformis]
MDDDDDVNLYTSEGGPTAVPQQDQPAKAPAHSNEASSGSDAGSDDESEDEVEIVLTAPSTDAQPGAPASSSAASAALAAQSTDAQDKDAGAGSSKAAVKHAIGMPIPRQDSTAPAIGAVAGAPGSAAAAAAVAAGGKPGVDFNAVAKYEGKDLFDVELESFEDKPWRKPGADITDYFNYGFNEQTWNAYCSKQRAMRDELELQKRMSAYETMDYGFDMQAFAAQQRMLGAPAAAFPAGKFQRAPAGGTAPGTADGIQRSQQQPVLGKRSRFDDEAASFPGDSNGEHDGNASRPAQRQQSQPIHGFPHPMGFPPRPDMFGGIPPGFPGHPFGMHGGMMPPGMAPPLGGMPMPHRGGMVRPQMVGTQPPALASTAAAPPMMAMPGMPPHMQAMHGMQGMPGQPPGHGPAGMQPPFGFPPRGMQPSAVPGSGPQMPFDPRGMQGRAPDDANRGDGSPTPYDREQSSRGDPSRDGERDKSRERERDRSDRDRDRDRQRDRDRGDRGDRDRERDRSDRERGEKSERGRDRERDRDRGDRGDKDRDRDRKRR